MISYGILISPIQHSDAPRCEGEFFEVLLSSGSISTPNGVQIRRSCEETRNNYIKEGIQEARDMNEWGLLKNWYIKIMPNIIFSIADNIGFSAKEQMEDLINDFPKNKECK